MSKQLLVLAMTATLTTTLVGCGGSSGGGGSTDDSSAAGGDTGGAAVPGGGTTAANPGGEAPVPSGAGAPSGDTKANNYVGDFGFGSGVYVVDRANRLYGLALNDDGSAVSLFGDLGAGDTFSGALRQQTHDASRPATAGVFGTGRSEFEAAGPFSLNFVSGQSIESTAPPQVNLTVASAGQISPATIASVAGTWTGSNRYGEGDDNLGRNFITEITFNGASVTGGTRIETDNGAESFGQPINGTISEYGDVLLVSFNWGSEGNLNQYDGIVFFTTDGTNRLVFLGETLAAGVGNPTISSLLRQ